MPIQLTPLEDYPGYFITKDGRVFKEKTLTVGSNGYQSTGFRRGDANRYIHDLVLETFVGKRPEGYDASHINGNRTDNRLENLLWESRKDNCRRQENHGTKLVGESRHNAKLTKDDVEWIRGFGISTRTFCRIMGNVLGVSDSTIYDVVTRKTWRHI